MDKEISKYKKGKVGLIPVTWNEKKIGDFAETSSGGTPSRNIKEFYQGGTINWFKTGELISKYIYESEEKITEKAIKETSAKIFPQDTILLAMYGASIGKLSILKKESATNQACCAILPNDNYDTEYLYYQLSFLKNRLIRKSAGAAQPNISQNIIRNFTVPFPSKNEQRKIASILSVWDNAIELKEKLIEQKKELKKGLMQKLLTGELRLPGFDGEWKNEKIKNISNVFRGASPRPISDPKWFDEQSEIGWVRISDVTKSNKVLLQTEQFLSDEGVKKSRLVKKNNIIMSICATVGKPIITGVDVCIHDGFVVFEDVQINKDYFYYALLRKENHWKKYGQTGSQMNLNTDIVGSEKILYPVDPFEQQAIADILNTVDREINLLESELEFIKEQKKGLLQLLLTGKVRVKV